MTSVDSARVRRPRRVPPRHRGEKRRAVVASRHMSRAIERRRGCERLFSRRARRPRWRAAASPGRRAASRRPPASRDAKPEKPESSNLPADSTTAFTLNVDGRSLAFHVTAGSLRLKDDAGAPQADVAYVAYQLDGADAATPAGDLRDQRRPGRGLRPGCNLGALGPWRLPMNGSVARLAAGPGRQRRNLARLHRPRLHRPAGDRLQPHRRAGRRGAADASGRSTATSTASTRRHPPLAGRRAAARLAQVHRRRKLRRLSRPASRQGARHRAGRRRRGLVLISPVLDFAALVGGPNDPFTLLTRLPSYAAAYRETNGPVAARRSRRRRALCDRRLSRRTGCAARATPRRSSGWSSASPTLTGHRPADRAPVRRPDRRGRRSCANSSARRARSSPSTTPPIDAYDPFPTASRSRFLDPVAAGFEPAFASAIVDLYERRLGWKVDDRYELLNDAVERDWNWGGKLARARIDHRSAADAGARPEFPRARQPRPDRRADALFRHRTSNSTKSPTTARRAG